MIGQEMRSTGWLLAACVLVASSSAQQCSSSGQDFVITQLGLPRFTVSPNGSCSCANFVGGASHLSGLENNAAIQSIVSAQSLFLNGTVGAMCLYPADCQAGLVCSLPARRCLKPLGTFCGATAECQDSAVCAGGLCVDCSVNNGDCGAGNCSVVSFNATLLRRCSCFPGFVFNGTTCSAVVTTGTTSTGATFMSPTTLPGTTSIRTTGVVSLVHDCSSTAATVAVDGDAAQLANCRTLQALQVSTSANITSLNLPNLEEVAGGVTYSGSSLQSISLPALTSVGSVFYLSHTSVQHVSAPSLRSVGLHLYLDHNLQMQTLDFSSLETVASYVYIDHCDALQTANFSSLTSVGSYVYVTNNAALTQMPMTSLARVGTDPNAVEDAQNYVYIAGNSLLCTDRMANWTAVQGARSIHRSGNMAGC